MEEMGISWKTYQNELSIPVGFEGEEEDWLANFTDNDLEFFKQYNVRLHHKHLDFMERYAAALQERIQSLQGKKDAESLKDLEVKQQQLHQIKEDQKIWNREKFDQLSDREKSIHKRAFVTNEKDPDYHKLVDMTYDDQGTERTMKVPAGDVLHQFRADVEAGELPSVSWLVPPCHFSDHPGSPWYGAWYISEVMDILTKNQEVWKKTIFIITYDENDGYFDHVPPFLPPHTANPDTGKASAGMDTRVEYVSMAQEIARGREDKRESAIGLGYRVPMLVISPWSKGGWVNSEVLDHTSNLQFLEYFFSAKLGKKLVEPQISDWRRTISGDLTSVFRVADGVKEKYPEPLEKDKFIQGIYNAKFKALPSEFKALSKEDIAAVQADSSAGSILPKQEPGIRPSSAIPYQLYVSGQYSAAERTFQLAFESRKEVFGEKTAGSPFIAYFPGKTTQQGNDGTVDLNPMHSRYYAVKAGDRITDHLPLHIFENQQYHVQVYGPNGFMREFKGSGADPSIELTCNYQADRWNKNQLSGNIELKLRNLHPGKHYGVRVTDHAYRAKPKNISLKGGAASNVIMDLHSSYGWYDFSVHIEGDQVFEQRFAGRVETGKHSFSDPFMGRV
ncbi:alkaline phosphatase family protein [Pedobacter sp. AW31-3R]|uniref:alkaline phosphatase family protein n=1 Tax=Pedobacter sp. AW31-3R TaxID=3445781 RepID=UPI003F9FAB33